MPDDKPMTTAELREAVGLLLARDEQQQQRRRQNARRRERERQKRIEESAAQVIKSIEVIKWCVISISSVMAISLVIGIAVLMQLEREAERIKGEVQVIQRDAEKIRDKIRHPLETLGATLGRRLEGNIGGFLDSGDDKPDR